MLLLYARDPHGTVLMAERYPDDMTGDNLMTAISDLAIKFDDCENCELVYKFIDDSSRFADELLDAEYGARRKVVQEWADFWRRT